MQTEVIQKLLRYVKKFMLKENRNKFSPKFSKQKVSEIDEKTFRTEKNTKLLKDTVKKKRKFTGNTLL